MPERPVSRSVHVMCRPFDAFLYKNMNFLQHSVTSFSQIYDLSVKPNPIKLV